MSDNDELVSKFMAFTGSADPGCASSYLEMSGGNLETAVGLYMEHEFGGGGSGSASDGGGGKGAAAHSGGSLDRGVDAGFFMDPDQVRAPDATRTMRLMDDNNHLHADPSVRLINGMMEEQLVQSAFTDSSTFRPRPRDVRATVNAAAAAALYTTEDDDDNHQEHKASDEDTDDDDDVVQVVGPNRLSDMFAAPTHLTHKAGGFQGARAMAKDSKRWLLVNLQRDSEFSSHALNRDVWRDELVENLVREGFIFWQEMDMHPEGRTYCERYQVRDFPHLAIIDPRTGRLLWRKEGWTQEDPMTAKAFAEIAMDFCSRNSFDRPPQAPRPAALSLTTAGAAASPASSLNQRPAKRPMHEMSEEEQLQAAMRASMEDQGNDGTTDNGDDNDDYDIHSVEYIVDDDDDEDDEDKGKSNAEDIKPTGATSAAAAAVADGNEGKLPSWHDELIAVAIGEEPGDGARIQLRMPDGKRVVRKFSISDPVKMIYAFVSQVNEEARGGREFTLMAGFPPTDMIGDLAKSIEECKLSGQAVTVRWKS